MSVAPMLQHEATVASNYSDIDDSSNEESDFECSSDSGDENCTTTTIDDDDDSNNEEEEDEEEKSIEHNLKKRVTPRRQSSVTRKPEKAVKPNTRQQKRQQQQQQQKQKPRSSPNRQQKSLSSPKKQTRQKQQQQQPQSQSLSPHLRTALLLKSRDELAKDLNNTILHQESAMVDVGSLLTMIKSNADAVSRGIVELRDRIHKRIFSGPSGVGKSETVKLVRDILGMDNGGPYCRQFIHIDGSVYKDITQLNRLTGSGPGYAGCEVKNSLVDDLLDAIMSDDDFRMKLMGIPRPKTNTTTTGTLNLTFNRKQSPSIQQSRSSIPIQKSQIPSPPPYILLFIDEVDKAHKDFMTIINGLLDEGQIRSSRGDHFILPQTTQLIVLFTSNYGCMDIAKMKVRNEHQAATYVEKNMHEKGLAPNSIERFGSHIIFFSMSRENLCDIIIKKVDTLMKKENPLTQYYGTIDYESAIECITDFIIRISDPVRGIRNSLKHLNDCITPLLLDAFYTLEEIKESKDEDSETSKIKWTFSEIDRLKLFKETLSVSMFSNYSDSPTSSPVHHHQYDDSISSNSSEEDIHHYNNNNNNNNNNNTTDDGLNRNDIIATIQRDVKNRQKLQVFQSDGYNHSIHAFGISRGNNIINCVIVPLIVNHYTITNYSTDNNYSGFIGNCEAYENGYINSNDAIYHAFDELKNDYKELKRDYCTIVTAINNANVDGRFDYILKDVNTSKESLKRKTKKHTKELKKKNKKRLLKSRKRKKSDDDDDEIELLAIEGVNYFDTEENKKNKNRKIDNCNIVEESSGNSCDDGDNNNSIIIVENVSSKMDGETRICITCGHLYPIDMFITRSSGNLRRDGTRGAQRISKRKICKPCCNKKYRKK